MKILIACEFSGIVRDAFIAKGHDAISCDILDSERIGPHYMGDVRDILYDAFDMMIAHPPCTYLCVSGNRAMKEHSAIRTAFRGRAIDFFMFLMNAPISKIAIENPVGVMSTVFRKPNQYIQPYEYGHPESKKTGLWLKNLPLLQPEKIVKPEYIICKGKRYSPTHYWTGGDKKKDKRRSITYQGIANAMANQWSNFDLRRNK